MGETEAADVVAGLQIPPTSETTMDEKEEESGVLDTGQREFEGRLCQAVQQTGKLTLSGQINMGGEMTVTTNHIHDNRVIHKPVQHHHGDVNHITNKFIKKGDIIQQTQYNTFVQTNRAHIEGQSRLEMASTREVFVATESYRQALQRLSIDGAGLLIITGPPGSGKSSLAHALLQHYSDQDYMPLVVKTYEEWRLHVGGDGKQVVLLDHVLGREELDRSHFQQWAESLQTLRAFVCGDKCLAVVTVNDQVFEEATGEGGFDAELLETVLDLSETPLFTEDEKMMILKKHLSRKGKSISKSDLDDILRKDLTGPMFPSLCRQYANMLDKDPNPEKVFTDSLVTRRPSRQPKTSPLHNACYLGDNAAVAACLEQGMSIEITDRNGDTPLHVASRYGYHDIVQNLLTKGVSAGLNMTNSEGQTPTDLACKYGSSSVVGILLAHGSHLNETARSSTLLHEACRRGCLETVKVLLEHKANINHADKHGQTALHVVLEDRNQFHGRNLYEIVKRLLQHNADVRLADDFGTTPLDLVFTYSQNECMQKMILFQMAQNDTRTTTGATALHLASQYCSEDVIRYLLRMFPSMSLDSRDNYGATPLLTAVMSRNVFRTNVIKYLLATDADIYTTDHKGSCPFEEYIKRDSELLELFVQHGADVHRVDRCGNSLLHQACRESMDKYGLCKLIAYGISIHSKNHDGDTPLHIACGVGNLGAAKLLLAIGKCTDAKNNAGKSPIDVAFEHNQTGLLSLLMYSQINCSGSARDRGSTTISQNNRDCLEESGLDHSDSGLGDMDGKAQRDTETLFFPSKCARGQTELHTACIRGNVAAVDALIEEGADIKLQDSNGQTPLHHASSHGYVILVDLLLQHGAETNVVNHQGQSPLHLACSNGHSSTAAVLLSYGADVNDVDGNSETALHLAVRKRHLSATTVLLGKGASVNSRDRNGNTALHLAALHGDTEASLLLLRSGSQMRARNQQRHTAIALASSMRHTVLVEIFERHAYFVGNKERRFKTVYWQKVFLLPAVLCILTWMCWIL